MSVGLAAAPVSLSRRALLGLVAGLPLALKGIIATPTIESDEDLERARYLAARRWIIDHPGAQFVLLEHSMRILKADDPDVGRLLAAGDRIKAQYGIVLRKTPNGEPFFETFEITAFENELAITDWWPLVKGAGARGGLVAPPS